MSKRLRRNLPVLKTVLSLKPKQRKKNVCHSSEDLILALCEIALNVLKGNIPLTSTQYSKLNKQKKFIKLFADRKTGLPRKRKVLRQSGGFILPLLASSLPFLFNLFTAR